MKRGMIPDNKKNHMFTLWTKNIKTIINPYICGIPNYYEIVRMPGFQFTAGVCTQTNKIYFYQVNGELPGRYVPDGK